MQKCNIGQQEDTVKDGNAAFEVAATERATDNDLHIHVIPI